MQFNPQMLMQMMMQRNPGMMQQFQQFQQMMQNNPQMQQQYRQFRENMNSNPQMRDRAIKEATQKVNEMPTNSNQPAGNAMPSQVDINNSNINIG